VSRQAGKYRVYRNSDIPRKIKSLQALFLG
jgi:hypothetical protein